MKKFLFCAGLMVSSLAFGQVVFEENWDGDGPGIDAWTVLDLSGNTPAEQVSYAVNGWTVIDRGGEPPNMGGPDGDFAAVSTSWFTPAGTANAWLISPEIELPATPVSVIWDAKAQDPLYRDGYELRLAPNAGTTPEDFSVVLFTIESEVADWTTRLETLAEYAGTTVRLAWVNNSTDMFVLLIDNITVEPFEASAPSCVTLNTPEDGASVDPADAFFSWTPVEGEDINNYTFYLGDSEDNLQALGDLTGTSTPVTGLQYGTTYYWTVLPNNIAGSPTDCTIYSFTTIDSIFEPYCGPLSFSFNVEPITLVNFAGIDNPTSNEIGGVAGHQLFTDMVAQVTPGETYTITLAGNTDGPYENRFAVFIDWNQNGVLDDPNEVYQVTQTINNTTGIDGTTVTHQITVPQDAVPGETRMRVKKIYGTTEYLNPCAGGSFGHAQDYLVNVGSLSTIDAGLTRSGVYPNPTKDVLNITGADVSKVRVYNMLGQEVRVNYSNNIVDVNRLTPGNYVLQIENLEGEIQTVKFIKR